MKRQLSERLARHRARLTLRAAIFRALSGRRVNPLAVQEAHRLVLLHLRSQQAWDALPERINMPHLSDNPSITPDLVSTLKAEHGDVVLLSLGQGDEGETDVIARRPTPTDYNQFKAEGMDRDERPEVARRAVENLAKRCIVWPSSEVVGALTKRYPAMLDTYGGELLTLAGAAKRATVAKL